MSNTSQAQIFAAAYAKDTAKEMLDTIKATGVKAGRVSRIVLAVSMPHQIGFILGLAPLQWDDPRHILESLTLILGSVLIPVAVDYLILICIQIIAARGMARSVKKAAIAIMTFPILVSGAVNVIAPAPTVMRALFGVMVVLIPMAEGLRSFIRPDFAAIEKMETDVAAQVQPRTTVETAAEVVAEAERVTREAAEGTTGATATTTAPRPRPAVRAAASRTRRTTLTAKLPDGYSVSDDRRVVRPDGRVLSERHSRRYINGTK